MQTYTTRSASIKFRKIIKREPGTIRALVAQEALDHIMPETFFEDFLPLGCHSGFISSLISYADTHAFYDKHYAEIEKIRIEYEADIGQPMIIHGDLKNFFAWFAYEEAAYYMALNDFGLEI